MAKRKNKAREKPAPVVTMDAFSNPAARLGFGTMDLTQATTYPMTRLTQNYELLTSLYRDNWIVQNIVATIPNDMIRKWYEIKSGIAPDYINQMVKLERRTQIRKKLLLGMYWGRLYGGAVGVILIKGQNDMSQPLDLDMVLPGSFLGLQILDRWSGVYPEGELVTDPSDPDFGLPAYYTIRDDTTGYMVARVHHSRIIRFIGRSFLAGAGDGNLLGRIGAGGHLQRDCSPRQCGGKYRRADLPGKCQLHGDGGAGPTPGYRKHRNAAPFLECTGGAIHYGEQFRHPSYQQR